MKCQIIFRGEGNSKIGLGHLSRLVAFANNLNYTDNCCFVLSELSDKSIIPQKIKVRKIKSDLNTKQEVSWINNNFDNKKSIIVLDGYQFDEEYQLLLKKEGFKLVYIDDLIDRHQYADVVLNHAIGVLNHDYKNKESYTRFKLGTKYALLRESFLNEAKKEKGYKEVETAFVCFGGADPLNFTKKSIVAFLKFEQIKKINIVLGSSYAYGDSLKEFENLKKIKIFNSLNEKEMLSVMKDSQIAIVPSSTIVYELCCVQMLIISGYYVDNQIKIYNGLIKERVIIDAGNIKDSNEYDFHKVIKKTLLKQGNNELLLNQKKLFNHTIKRNINELIKDLC